MSISNVDRSINRDPSYFKQVLHQQLKHNQNLEEIISGKFQKENFNHIKDQYDSHRRIKYGSLASKANKRIESLDEIQRGNDKFLIKLYAEQNRAPIYANAILNQKKKMLKSQPIRSLNFERRVKEAEQIATENQRILDSILQCKSQLKPRIEGMKKFHKEQQKMLQKATPEYFAKQKMISNIIVKPSQIDLNELIVQVKKKKKRCKSVANPNNSVKLKYLDYI